MLLIVIPDKSWRPLCVYGERREGGSREGEQIMAS